MSNNEPVATRWRHSPETWKKRQHFTSRLEEACQDKGIDVHWLDDEKWTGILRSPDGEAPIYGYDLGLNSSASAKLADSKTDTFQALHLRQIPAIYHERVSPNLTNGERLGTAALTAIAIEAVGLPMVTKPDALASGGAGVELCREKDEVHEALGNLTTYGRTAAVSPYVDFDEYRAVILDGEVRAVIEKTKQPNGWMHNHSKGAEHRLLKATEGIRQEIGALGIRAAGAVGLHFTTVDIARMARDELAVLELNDAVSIVYPDDPELEAITRDVYGDAARLRLARG